MILKKVGPEISIQNQIYLLHDAAELFSIPISKEECVYLQKRLKEEQRFVEVNRLTSKLVIAVIPSSKDEYSMLELWRRKGNEAALWAKEEKIKTLGVVTISESSNCILAFLEGAVLGSYQFLKYNSKAAKVRTTLEELLFIGDQVDQKQLDELSVVTESVFIAKDLVNEPVVNLNAETFGISLKKMGEEFGVSGEVLGKQAIEDLRMGGLLAVNKGSLDPPSFTILEWKPENAVNSQPVVLVGKGVVFDTGGLSLKPTAKSMDYMKCDMAGGAAAAASICVAARNKLPLHVIALIPATDNRPGGNAITPGDVITISDGSTVEVLNTDAEGRLLLADALHYAKKYNPLLVIDLATLTGSASMTLGIHGIAGMGVQCGEYFETLKKSGNRVYERIVELPLWDEYDEMIKSNIADVKNIGGGEAGAITAGKFLQRFVTYPWIHLDIAGPAFLHTTDHYRQAGGTATGVRLLTDFFNLLIQQAGQGSNSPGNS